GARSHSGARMSGFSLNRPRWADWLTLANVARRVRSSLTSLSNAQAENKACAVGRRRYRRGADRHGGDGAAWVLGRAQTSLSNRSVPPGDARADRRWKTSADAARRVRRRKNPGCDPYVSRARSGSVADKTQSDHRRSAPSAGAVRHRADRWRLRRFLRRWLVQLRQGRTHPRAWADPGGR